MKFVLGEIFPDEEDLYTEFKEIKANNSIHSLKDNTDRYIIGFANAGVRGSIYYGIADDREIKGFKMDSKTKDRCDQIIHNKLKNIRPALVADSYKVIWHVVENSKQEKLYVVEVTVDKQIMLAKPFESSSGKVYCKKGKVCEELKREEIDNLFISNLNKINETRLEIVYQEIKNCSEKDSIRLETLYDEMRSLGRALSNVQVIKDAYAKLESISKNKEKLLMQEVKDLSEIKRFDDALEILDKVLIVSPPNSTLSSKKGYLLYKLNKVSSALKEYELAVTQNPENYQAWVAIGEILMIEGEYQEALNSFQKALRICPEYRVASYKKKHAYAKLRKSRL